MIHESLIYQDQFGTPDMRAVWTERAMMQAWLDFEAAVSRTQGEMGIISRDIAEKICRNCKTQVVTPKAVAAWNRRTRHVIVALVKAFRDAVPDAGEQFHLGLTTQDVLDTGLTLQIRDALRLLLPATIELQDSLLNLAHLHRDTIMMGRSEGQHGAPITFGYKMAVLAWEIQDHIERLLACSERLRILTMFGVMGVQSSYCLLAGESRAKELVDSVAEKLQLSVPPICPHHRTDRFAELGFQLSLLTSTLGEAGLEIRDLQRTEVAEVTEPWNVKEQFSSSTLPHKQNPEPSEWQEGLATLSRGHALALLDTQQQHERDISRLPPLLHSLPNLFLIAASAVNSATDIFGGLQVNADRMWENVMMRGGLAMAESVMLGLAKSSGRKVWAHQLVHDIAMQVARSDEKFADVLSANAEIGTYLNKRDIDVLMDPKSYVGTAASQVEDVVANIQSKRAEVRSRIRDALGQTSVESRSRIPAS